MPLGSNASLMLLMTPTPTPTLPTSSSNISLNFIPTPCSPITVPSKLNASLQICLITASANSLSSAQQMIAQCTFPSPTCPTFAQNHFDPIGVAAVMRFCVPAISAGSFDIGTAQSE